MTWSLASCAAAQEPARAMTTRRGAGAMLAAQLLGCSAHLYPRASAPRPRPPSSKSAGFFASLRQMTDARGEALRLLWSVLALLIPAESELPFALARP